VPTYSYMNVDTLEEFDIVMPMSQLDEYEKANPNHARVYTKVNIADPAGIGVSKPPADFSKHVLGRIKHQFPGAPVERRWNIPKEV